MNISHELPLCFLNDLDRYNDYEFILPRFWKKNEEYKNHYKNSTKFKILDNGLFEGDNFSIEDLINIINEVKPNIFVVPDVWNDYEKTYLNAGRWFNELKDKIPKETKLMVVLQGNSLGQFEALYEDCVRLGYRHFAFNHSSRCYGFMENHSNNEVKRMFGRIHVIHHLKATQYIQQNHYIHLLGCSLPQEFMYYKDIKIDSIDTSNPIICGILDIKYRIGGLLKKPSNKMEEFMEKDLTSKINLVISNIIKFKEFCK